MATSEAAASDHAEEAQRRRRPAVLLLGIVTAAIVVGAAVGRLAGRGGEAGGLGLDDPGVVHVHGLGINPADAALYAATHTGLFRLDDDGHVERIGDRHQDTMGFTVAGPDRFLASGHPDLRDEDLLVEGKPPLLGLIESTDAGHTWRVRSLLGDADLHTIAAAGDLLVAYDSTGQRVLASRDGGRSWETRAEIPLVDLAVDPDDPERLAAIALRGATLMSADGGRTWRPDNSAPAGLAVLRWSDDGLWAGGGDGTIHRADAPGRGWSQVHAFGGAVEALLVQGGAVFAAIEGSGIYTSPDRGRSWRQLYRPPAD